MEVRTVKLLNGDEVIGDLKGIFDGFLHFDNLVVLQMMQHPETGKVMRAFGDYPALAAPGQTVRIPVTSVLSMPLNAHEELERQFIANVTGLDLPPAQPKILLS